MRVWFDFENSPHVPFLLPFLEELTGRGWEVVATARDRSQTGPLLDLYRIPHRLDRDRTPRSAPAKAAAVIGRAVDLARRLSARRPHLAIGHGSRSQILAARLLGVPAVSFIDYEHVSIGLFRLARRLLVPEVTRARFGPGRQVVGYPGVKEEIYLHQEPPAARAIDPYARLGIAEDAVRVVVRGPATRAHYLGDAGTDLFDEALARLLATDGVEVVLFERYADARARPAAPNLHRPDGVFDVRALLAGADLVVGGGGTMVREAAVAGVPAVSLFVGRPGAVDASLVEGGRLSAYRSVADLDGLVPRRRPRRGIERPGREVFDWVLERTLECARR